MKKNIAISLLSLLVIGMAIFWYNDRQKLASSKAPVLSAQQKSAIQAFTSQYATAKNNPAQLAKLTSDTKAQLIATSPSISISTSKAFSNLYAKDVCNAAEDNFYDALVYGTSDLSEFVTAVTSWC